MTVKLDRPVHRETAKRESARLLIAIIASLGGVLTALQVGCGKGPLSTPPRSGAGPGGQLGHILGGGGLASGGGLDGQFAAPGAAAGGAAGLGTGGMGSQGVGGGTASSGGAGGGQPGTSLTARAWIAAQCADTSAPLVRATSTTGVYPQVRGRWASCDAAGLFNTDWPGLEIGSMTFRFLTWASDGRLVPTYGENVEGQLGSNSGAMVFYLNFGVTPSVTAYASLTSTTPQQMVIGGVMGTQYRYVALPAELTEEVGFANDGGGNGGAGPPSITGPFDRNWIARACTQRPGSLHELADLDPIASSIQGRWARCGSTGLFGLDWPGVEIGTTTFNFLGWSPDETLSPYYGVDCQGLLGSSPSPPDPIAVTFALTYPDTLVASPSITTHVSLSAGQPRQLIIDGATGEHDRYIALPDGAFLGPGGVGGGVGGMAGGGGMTGTGGLGGTRGTAGSTGSPAGGACHKNGDCQPGLNCYIAAPVSDCATAPVGTCIRYVESNCALLPALHGPCDCLTFSTPTVYDQCEALGSFTCNGSTGGYEGDYLSPDSCFGCFPSVSQSYARATSR